jgi:hypothetical protein
LLFCPKEPEMGRGEREEWVPCSHGYGLHGHELAGGLVRKTQGYRKEEEDKAVLRREGFHEVLRKKRWPGGRIRKKE